MSIIDDKLVSYRKLQSDLQSLYAQKTQILSQLNENTLVKGELDLLTDTSTVYKLVGPVLISVDVTEAKENVSKRLQFIEGEISKVESSIATEQQEHTSLGNEIAEIQQKMQQEAASAVKQLVN